MSLRSHEVGVLRSHRRAPLLQHAHAVVRGGALSVEDLDGHLAGEHRVEPAIDRGHTAAPEALAEVITLRERRA
jgi:hypothetical protein